MAKLCGDLGGRHECDRERPDLRHSAGSRVTRSELLSVIAEWVGDHLKAWHNRDHDD